MFTLVIVKSHSAGYANSFICLWFWGVKQIGKVVLFFNMPIDHIFPSPTVKTVAYEVKFPNLFYLESKIGDLQLKLIEQFPESSVFLRRQIMIGDSTAPEMQNQNIEDNTVIKVWQFKSPMNYLVNIQSNSIVISSEFHKTYNLGTENKFRDVIIQVVDAFLELTKIPSFTRVGLRYVDECPIAEKNNESFLSYYNSALALNRFNIADATEMGSRTVVKKDNSFLIYAEMLQQVSENEWKLILDFDGFQEKVNTADYLAVTDNLHDLVSAEFETSIKEPVIQLMEQEHN